MTDWLGFQQDATPADRRRVGAVLVVSVLAVSSAAVIVRAIEDVHPVVVALWRTTLVALLLAPGLRPIAARDAGLTALAGAALALHFAVWFASLSLTTVLRSTALVTLAPVWVGLIEWGVRGRRPPDTFWLGLAVAVPGVLIMATGEGGAASLLGDGLALLGGMAGAVYFAIGRVVRRRVPITTYAPLVAATAALVLLPAAVGLGAPVVGFDVHTWVLLAALAVGPQLLGHNGVNYALGWVEASTVSTLLLLEPVGAALLALALLGEVPSALGWAGALLVVLGVGVATRRR